METNNKNKCDFGYCKEYKEGDNCQKCSEIAKSKGYTGCVFAITKKSLQ